MLQNGGWTLRGSVTGVTFVSGDVLLAKAFANGTVQIYRNGLLLGTVNASAWPHAAKTGRIGIASLSSTSVFMDNFGGGTAQ